MSAFITFEGPDGSGKSTQIHLLAEFLRGQGYDVLTTREPGGTPIGEQIRDVLHSLHNKAMSPRAEILLYCASRAQLVEQLIRPHLATGGVVLCDRYADSTLAYQGYGHGLPLLTLRMILGFATGGLRPDVTIYLDVESDEGLQRRKASGDEWNRMDEQSLDFHRRVRLGYLALAHDQPQRWRVLDGARPVDLIAEDIRAIVAERLADWKLKPASGD
ncbi:MAG: dTMP kinase [Thermoflexales bacterium]|nr:dTMP kinase [Thermoflexales bacterium]